MRMLILLALTMLSSSKATADDVESIKPGMALHDVTATLIRHGYGVGSEHGGAIVSGDKNVGLEFCTIDAKTTLVISYRKKDRQVVALTVHFYPDKLLPKSKRQDVQRKIRKILFDEDGAFTVSLERVDAKEAKRPPAVANPFD